MNNSTMRQAPCLSTNSVLVVSEQGDVVFGQVDRLELDARCIRLNNAYIVPRDCIGNYLELPVKGPQKVLPYDVPVMPQIVLFGIKTVIHCTEEAAQKLTR